MLSERLLERLKAIEASAQQLTPELQERLADQIAAAFDNALWDAQLRDPEHLAVLREMAQEARREPKLPMPKPSDTGDEHLLNGYCGDD